MDAFESAHRWIRNEPQVLESARQSQPGPSSRKRQAPSSSPPDESDDIDSIASLAFFAQDKFTLDGFVNHYEQLRQHSDQLRQQVCEFSNLNEANGAN